jgi:hypothetical protein
LKATRLLFALLLCATALDTSAAPDGLRLPGFPLPALVLDGGPPKEMSSVRLLRELHRGGVHGSDNLETSDSDYALLRSDSLGNLAAWLESACLAVDADLLQARTRDYDGAVFARLLAVATSLAALRQGNINLAMPIGVLICQRRTVWGDLPGDGATDAYVVFVTDNGMLVYDPPTRQLTNLADFPNKAHIGRIRF